MKKLKKSRELKISEAAEALQKAIDLPLPDIQIALYGPYDRAFNETDKSFGEAFKKFKEEYEKYIGRKPILNIIVR